ncbi:MAG TPA: TonB-dependent receptor [Steroidobacteraceae bacterium]|nr:TonB-dependent receptor [Steroidobacteraceae bacterium]
MSKIVRSAASLAALLSLPLAAAEPPLGNTVVTATRTETVVDEVLAPVIVITREELERSLAPDVASLLQFHAGIDIGRNGGPGQATSIFIRGTDSNHATVLVDGVRVNPGTIGGASIQNIAPETIERIEIVKGPRSTLYGTDAIGGVINLITRSYPDNGFDAATGYGRYDTFLATASGGFGGEASQVAFSANWLESAGFPARTFDGTDRGYDNTSFTVKGRTQLGAVRLGARYWQASGTSEYSDFLLTPVDQDFENRMAALDATFAPTERWSSRVTVSHIEDEIEQNQADFLGNFARVRTRRNAADWQNDVHVGEHQLVTAGALLTQEETISTESFAPFDEDTDTAMVFAQDRIDFGRHDVLLAAAYLDHETFGEETTWNAEYGIDVTVGLRLIAAAGTGFRAPDSTDRFGFGGNPALDPEHSRNYELSLVQRFGERQQLRLSAFRNEIEDLIVFVVTDPVTFEGQNQNVERARIDGVELAYEYDAPTWRLRAEAIAQDPRNLTTDEKLLRRASESLTLAFAKALGAHELGFDVLLSGEREDFGTLEQIELEGYALVNLYARFALMRGLSLQVRLENAFDEQYELASTYNTPDRSVFLALRYEVK